MIDNKIIIVTGCYDENIGGSIVPHQLCKYVNKYTDYDCYMYRAYIYPSFRDGSITKSLWVLFSTLAKRFLLKIKSIPDNSKYLLYRKPRNLDDYVVVYLDGMADNPLNAKNVVRLLLHNPGYFSKEVHYNCGELYFLYGPHFNSVNILDSETSKNFVDIKFFNTELYNSKSLIENRDGVCHLVRKGKVRDIDFDLSSSVLIDGKSHKEIAAIFKRSKYYISFDTESAYSILAALCGCISIVVPIQGVNKITWQPDEKFRYGVAYGFSKEEIDWAISSQGLLNQHIIDIEEHNKKVAMTFTKDLKAFFNGDVDA
ncbi:hypothetical protein C9J12_02790 [Photobacterium frigidiphilum]|uniref:WavQ n=1 Tax=Photobacterium frigidiphilum TaxID=264736 RepID=A0A2T3JPC6_9GAMM|nr:hypothetical protein [Photobacterium frigidiphilum]PSU50911.1 hypothetical protein C9J12_02790 [Photobacterium frigidiphilum]